MVIIPNTDISLLKNVPLDTTYRNTIYFSDAASQRAYFLSKAKHTLASYSYQREDRFLKAGISADSAYDCNYMMFRNTAYGNKTFYAFITNVEFINNTTCKIDFEIDVMQTWAFDYDIMPSFVEREHSLTDNIGDNTIPENIFTGDAIPTEVIDPGKLLDYDIMIAASFDVEMSDIGGAMYGKCFSGIKYNICSTWQAAIDFIDAASMLNKTDGILGIYMIPKDFYVDVGEQAKVYPTQVPTEFSNIDGYTPKNKKLFTYPYNYLEATNHNGAIKQYRYEYFESSTQYVQFWLTGDVGPQTEVFLIPQRYNGQFLNYDERISIDSFPICSYTTDAYRAWLAQNSGSQILQVAQSLGSIGAGVAAGAATGGAGLAAGGSLIASGAAGIANVLNQNAVASSRANNIASSPSGVALLNTGQLYISIHKMCIRNEYAKIADEYFNVYGYACNRIKVPNIGTRPYWNYVKCIDANIKGSVPAPDMQKIVSIYNNGVTFWKHGSNVGNYNLNNGV